MVHTAVLPCGAQGLGQQSREVPHGLHCGCHGAPAAGSFVGLRPLQGSLRPAALHGPLAWVTRSPRDLCLVNPHPQTP